MLGVGRLNRSVLFVASVTKKHILQFHTPYLKWFKEQGYTVHVCAGNDFEPGEKAEIPYCDKYFEVPFSRSPLSMRNIHSYFEIKQIAKENSYDIIHCHTPIAAALARQAFSKAHKKGTVVLYTAHGFHFYKGAPKISKLYYMVEKHYAKKTDGLITINEEDYIAASKFGKRMKCRIFRIPGIGAQLDRIHNCARTREEMRSEFGIPNDAFLVISNSEINQNKNNRASISAVAANKGTYLIICGIGDMLGECVKFAEELGAQDRVIFAGYRKDAKELLNMADAFMLPSFREGLSMAAIEGMAAGLPLIVSDNRSSREYARQGENAIICDASDTEGFIEAVRRLSTDPDLCRRLGENGRKTAEKYDLKNVLLQMESIYREFLPSENAE